MLTCAMLSARLCRSLGRGKEGGGGVEEAMRKHTSDNSSFMEGSSKKHKRKPIKRHTRRHMSKHSRKL